MLKTIRKFSSSIFAKIILFVVAIPFIFWGMGPLFVGGNIKTIVKIGNKKILTDEFVNFVHYRTPSEKILDKNSIEKLLKAFIGEKLIALEIENLDIKFTDNSLRTTIKNEETFKKDNKFSRTEYEKFLIKNELNAVLFEAKVSEQEKKEQLFDFIGGGVLPSNFLVNMTYDKINQKRNIEVINLNDIFDKKINFSENQIKLYFNQNKESYKDVYKSVKFINLNPKNLTGNNEFEDLFFQKIDEIDNLIAEGKNLNYVLKKFNLVAAKSATFNKSGKNKNSETVDNFPIELIKNVFNINETEPIVLIEQLEKYFIVELTKSENLQKKITDVSIKKEILLNLEKQAKRKLISDLINQINKNNFKKTDFDKLSNDENVLIKKIKLENQNDNKVLKQELINQIYAFSEKKIIVVTDIGLSENFLIYIDKIENTSINFSSDDYKKYLNLSKDKIKTVLYSTYDSYLSDKYKITINYKALDAVKNTF